MRFQPTASLAALASRRLKREPLASVLRALIARKVGKMLQVSLEEAKSRLLELVSAVLKGETVVILKDFQEAVQLVPAMPLARRQFGSGKGLITMSEDFDAPLTDFNAYMP